jgi:hypothetical protein
VIDWLLLNAKWAISFFFSYIMAKRSSILMKWWCCHLYTRPTCFKLNFYSSSSLKQQSAGRHVASLRHITFILDQHASSWIPIVLAHWNNSLLVDMSFHSDTLSIFRANQSLLLLISAACLAEKQKYQFDSLYFDLTGLKFTINHTRGRVHKPLHHRCGSCFQWDFSLFKYHT